MTNSKQIAITYFLGRALFIGFGFSLLCKMLQESVWVSALIGTVIGFLFLLFLQKYKEKHHDETILSKIAFFLFNLFIFIELGFILTTFCSSFYLVKSPTWYIILPIPFIIYTLTRKGVQTVLKVAESLFLGSLILYVLVIFGLFKEINFSHFTPILTKSLKDILLGSCYFAIYSITPFLLLWKVNTNKNLAKMYLFSMLGIILIAVFILGVLGPNLAKIYRFPEYMTLKKIKLFNFIEKVENIISISSLLDLFLTMAICGINLKDLLPDKNKKIVYPLFLGLLALVIYYFSIHYEKQLFIYTYLPLILGGGIIICILTSLIHKKRKH